MRWCTSQELCNGYASPRSESGHIRPPTPYSRTRPGAWVVPQKADHIHAPGWVVCRVPRNLLRRYNRPRATATRRDACTTTATRSVSWYWRLFQDSVAHDRNRYRGRLAQESQVTPKLLSTILLKICASTLGRERTSFGWRSRGRQKCRPAVACARGTDRGSVACAHRVRNDCGKTSGRRGPDRTAPGGAQYKKASSPSVEAAPG
jgi:hypothetical protein